MLADENAVTRLRVCDAQAHRFGLRLGRVDADVAEEIRRVLHICAQLLPEASAAPPRCTQQEDRNAPQNCDVQYGYDRGH